MMEPLKPKVNHKAIGEISEAIIIAKLLETGYGVLMPFGDNLRYDLILKMLTNNYGMFSAKRVGWMKKIGN